MTNVEKMVEELKIDSEVNVKENLPVFLEKKKIFLEDPTLDHSVDMKIAYERIYLNFKHLWYEHEITEQNFYQLKELLQEGL